MPEPAQAQPNARPEARTGLRLVRAAVGFVVAFAGAALGWIAWQAARNPDVRARRPRWLDAEAAFDWAFWTPLLLTVGIGVGLVLAVFVRTWRRLARGEDLYTRRLGRGVRRRGERHLDEGRGLDEKD